MKHQISLFEAPAKLINEETFAETVKNLFEEHHGDDTPFFIMDVGDIIKKVKTWRILMPRVKLFYAMKCNDHPFVLKLLAALGTGFDCASKDEFDRILRMGVDQSRIIYANPCRPVSQLRAAKSQCVDLMTFDNKIELAKVKTEFPAARLVLRIRCDALVSMHNLGNKFGVLPEYAPVLLQAAKDLDLNVVGVAFHVGSECEEPQVFLRAIKHAREIFDTAKEFGYNFKLLDIGGGFRGSIGTTLDEMAYYINQALEEHFPNENDLEVIGEPGTYVVASAFTLVTKVVSKQCADLLENKSPFSYYVNEGTFGSLNFIKYGHKVFPSTLKVVRSEDQLYKSTVWGPTCDSNDIICSDILLPELHIDDCIYWRDMGAYTVVLATEFNGFPPANVDMIVTSVDRIYLDKKKHDKHNANYKSEEVTNVKDEREEMKN